MTQASPKEEAEALKNKGNAFLQAGDAEAAEKAYREAIRTDAACVPAWNNLGNLLYTKGEINEAIKAYQTALKHAPEHGSSLMGLANALIAAGKPEVALPYAQAAVQVNPQNVLGYNTLGFTLHILHRLPDAKTAYETALKLQPGYAEAHNNLGNVLLALGEQAEAEQAYRNAISLKPAYARAWQNFAFAHRFQPDDPLIGELENRFASALGKDRMAYAFGLSKAYYDSKQDGKLFPALDEANRLMRQNITYDPRATENRLHTISQFFNAGYFAAQSEPPLADSPATPVFIVGMPRSGTTLTEQILATHPDVFGAGEVDFLPDSIQSHGGLLEVAKKPELWPAVRKYYLQRLRGLDESAQHPFITDKLPANGELLGLAAVLFPQARIIWCVRNPLDTGFSIYRQHFTGHHPYAYDLTEIGHYIRHYNRLMEHWQEVLPLPIQVVEYETLVKEPETTVRELLAFCGLEWHAGCLHFHQSSRTVKTASATQVRQKLYDSAIASSQRFAQELAPLQQALEK